MLLLLLLKLLLLSKCFSKALICVGQPFGSAVEGNGCEKMLLLLLMLRQRLLSASATHDGCRKSSRSTVLLKYLLLLLLVHHVRSLSWVMGDLRRVTIGCHSSKGRAVVVVPGEEPTGSVTESIGTGEGVVTSSSAIAVCLTSFHLRLKAVRPQVMQGRGLAVRVQGVVLRRRRRGLSSEKIAKSMLHPLRVFMVDGVTLVRRRSNIGLAHIELAIGRSPRLLLLVWQRWGLRWRVCPARWRSPVGRGCRLPKGLSRSRHPY